MIVMQMGDEDGLWIEVDPGGTGEPVTISLRDDIQQVAVVRSGRSWLIRRWGFLSTSASDAAIDRTSIDKHKGWPGVFGVFKQKAVPSACEHDVQQEIGRRHCQVGCATPQRAK
jgi:hypothetical protein